MSSIANAQWRPVTRAETATDDAMSVRVWSDMADSHNNAKHHALVNPLRDDICFPPWTSRDNTITQHVIAIFAPVYVPDGYNRIRWHINHRRIAGTSTIVWRMKTHQGLYIGDQITYEPTKLIGSSHNNSITTNQNTWEPEWNTMQIEPTEQDSTVWIMITAQNGDTPTRGEFCGLKIIPYQG